MEPEEIGENKPPLERWEASHQDTAQTMSTFFAQLPLEYALVLQVPGIFFKIICVAQGHLSDAFHLP